MSKIQSRKKKLRVLHKSSFKTGETVNAITSVHQLTSHDCKNNTILLNTSGCKVS